MWRLFKNIDRKGYKPTFGALDIVKYIGPGLLVTVGFIDPGNWASNLSAGANFGYKLLWVITLSTIMLIVMQHNVAHLGIVSGLCLSEAASIYLKPLYSKFLLSTAMMASISTSFAEILGGAIALNMLFSIPIKIAAVLIILFSVIMLLTHSYRFIERWIIAFVSLIGISFIYELSLVKVDWGDVFKSSIAPNFPEGSIIVIMSVLGAVVMPHNLFLHSEVVQSRQWHKQGDVTIKRQLKFEFIDTLFSMLVGWAINSAIVILSASVFYNSGTNVTDLQQAKDLLKPLVGTNASVIFATALLLAGISSTITSGMAGGIIFSGLYKEPYDANDNHSRVGILTSYIIALLFVFITNDLLNALIYSQMFLSLQLPFTLFLQIYLTSSEKVMGIYKNTLFQKLVLLIFASIVSVLNVYLVISLLI